MREFNTRPPILNELVGFPEHSWFSVSMTRTTFSPHLAHTSSSPNSPHLPQPRAHKRLLVPHHIYTHREKERAHLGQMDGILSVICFVCLFIPALRFCDRMDRFPLYKLAIPPSLGNASALAAGQPQHSANRKASSNVIPSPILHPSTLIGQRATQTACYCLQCDNASTNSDIQTAEGAYLILSV